MTDRDAPTVGYQDCACRDCFDIYVGEPGELCDDCEAADCDPSGMCECQRDDAYGAHINCPGCATCEPFCAGD